jgi:hypothetical protein
MLDKSKIIEQVKKLLEVNQSNGATEAEEKIAMEKANMLIEKYQIENISLKAKAKIHTRILFLKKYPRLFNGVVSLIADYFGCIAFTQGSNMIIFGDDEFVGLTLDMAKRFEFEMESEVNKFKCSANYRTRKFLGTNSLVIGGWYIVHLGYLRKSIDFNQQQFKPDNMHTNKTPQQVIMSISSKIGMMVNGMSEGNKHKERTAMRSILNSFTDLSNSLGFETENVLKTNAVKLFDRMARNKMHGSGDER